jgi:hypothetical protein
MATERPLEEIAAISSRFEVGSHVLAVTRIQEGRWKVAVDGKPVEGISRNQAEAWEVGVREADRLDRQGK